MSKVSQTALTDQKKEQGNELVFSYLTLRNFIGFSGILLPILLPVLSKSSENEDVFQGSISAYYYTSAGDVFVIVICILSAFLLTYKGYNKLFERILLLLASVCGFLLTQFPTEWEEGMLKTSIHVQNRDVPKIGAIEWHWIFAGTFFVCLSLISIFYFTQSQSARQRALIVSENGKWTQKSCRNIIYITTGCLMLLSLLVILIYAITGSTTKVFGIFGMIYTMETVAVVSFGISWITKGETLFPDSNTPHLLLAPFRKMAKSRVTQPTAS